MLRVVFGWPVPNATRAVDERFSLENVEALLRSGRFEPVTAYHPSLSYLPQTVWLALFEKCGCLDLGTGSERVLDKRSGWKPGSHRSEPRPNGIRPVPGLTPLAFRSCRLLQALIGTATVALTYLLGCRLRSPAVGLGAAAIAAGTPWLIWASGVCNEDAGLVLTVLVAALATLAACRRPAAARFALVGLACGLALASKFNAAAVALPITVWVAIRWREWRALVPRLVLAGIVAAATFLALNPHLVTQVHLLKRDFGRTAHNYAQKSGLQGRSRIGVIVDGVRSPLENDFLGPLAGAAALGGLLLFVARSRATTSDVPDDSGRAEPGRLVVALGFPAGYLLLYAAATGNVSPHNWMPLAPYFALFAASVAERAWSPPSIAGLRSVWSRATSRGVAVAIVVSTAAYGVGFVYRALVPTTFTTMIGVLERLAHHPARVGVALSNTGAPAVTDKRSRRLHFVAPKSGPRFSAEELENLDGWIEPLVAKSVALDGGVDPAAARVEVVRPELFRRRGPALRLVWRPWHRAGVRREALLVSIDLHRFGFRAAPLPAPGAALASLRIWPQWRWRAGDCWLSSSARPRILLLAGSKFSRSDGGHTSSLGSERFTAAEASSLVLECSPRSRAAHAVDETVEIASWSARPRSPPAADGR